LPCATVFSLNGLREGFHLRASISSRGVYLVSGDSRRLVISWKETTGTRSIFTPAKEFSLAAKPWITVLRRSNQVSSIQRVRRLRWYKLRRVDGKWKVDDAVVENISIINNYRSQFDRVISSSSYDELVKRLRDKAGQRPTLRAPSPPVPCRVRF
jgi:hypothetical protein